MADGRSRLANPETNISAEDLGSKLIVALQSVVEPQVQMQAISDRNKAALRLELMTRLDAMETATKLWHEDLVRVPTLLDRAIQNLRELVHAEREAQFGQLSGEIEANSVRSLERLKHIEDRFVELNLRLSQGEAYRERALDAALRAAQILVDKQGELFGKQIGTLIKDVDDLKQQQRVQEGASGGSRTLMQQFIAAATLLILGAGVIFTALTVFHH